MWVLKPNQFQKHRSTLQRWDAELLLGGKLKLALRSGNRWVPISQTFNLISAKCLRLPHTEWKNWLQISQITLYCSTLIWERERERLLLNNGEGCEWRSIVWEKESGNPRISPHPSNLKNTWPSLWKNRISGIKRDCWAADGDLKMGTDHWLVLR